MPRPEAAACCSSNHNCPHGCHLCGTAAMQRVTAAPTPAWCSLDSFMHIGTAADSPCVGDLAVWVMLGAGLMRCRRRGGSRSTSPDPALSIRSLGAAITHPHQRHTEWQGHSPNPSRTGPTPLPCCGNASYALLAHVCEHSQGKMNLRPPTVFPPCGVFPCVLPIWNIVCDTMMISADPKESSKQDSGGTAQECKTIFLHTLDGTSDKVYNCA